MKKHQYTAKALIKWFQDCEVQYIYDWPGNHLNSNLVENLWHVIKQNLQSKVMFHLQGQSCNQGLIRIYTMKLFQTLLYQLNI